MSNGTVAIPVPKSFYNLDSELFDGVYNVWFFTSDTMPLIKSPVEIPLLSRKVTILSSLSATGQWGLQVRIDPKAAGGSNESGVAMNTIIIGLTALGILYAGKLTFDRIEKVVDENKFTFGLFGVAAAAVGLYLLIRAIRKS